jgi:hypothetical protein
MSDKRQSSHEERSLNGKPPQNIGDELGSYGGKPPKAVLRPPAPPAPPPKKK